jgi:hypothetical protein
MIERPDGDMSLQCESKTSRRQSVIVAYHNIAAIAVLIAIVQGYLFYCWFGPLGLRVVAFFVGLPAGVLALYPVVFRKESPSWGRCVVYCVVSWLISLVMCYSLFIRREDARWELDKQGLAVGQIVRDTGRFPNIRLQPLGKGGYTLKGFVDSQHALDELKKLVPDEEYLLYVRVRGRGDEGAYRSEAND